MITITELYSSTPWSYSKLQGYKETRTSAYIILQGFQQIKIKSVVLLEHADMVKLMVVKLCMKNVQRR